MGINLCTIPSVLDITIYTAFYVVATANNNVSRLLKSQVREL